MRKRFLGLALVVVLLVSMLFPMAAMAADPEVAITVQAALVSITNSQATWTVDTPIAVDGVVYFSADDAADPDYSQIENTGNVTCDIEIQGTDLTGTPTWTLAATTAADQYTLHANTEGAPTVYELEVKSSAYNDLKAGLAAAGKWDWSMMLTAPSSFGGTEDGTPKTGTVTLVASASA